MWCKNNFRLYDLQWKDKKIGTHFTNVSHHPTKSIVLCFRIRKFVVKAKKLFNWFTVSFGSHYPHDKHYLYLCFHIKDLSRVFIYKFMIIIFYSPSTISWGESIYKKLFYASHTRIYSAKGNASRNFSPERKQTIPIAVNSFILWKYIHLSTIFILEWNVFLLNSDIFHHMKTWAQPSNTSLSQTFAVQSQMRTCLSW